MSDEPKETLSPVGLRTTRDLPNVDFNTSERWQPEESQLAELVRRKRMTGATLHENLTQRAKLSTPLSFLVFLFRAFHTYLTVFLLAPQNVILNPISTIAAGIIYPTIGIFLWVALLVLWIFSLAGGNYLMEYLGQKYARGYSVINWLNPDIFVSKESSDTIKLSRAWLNGTNGSTTLDDRTPSDDIDDGTTRIFSSTLSRTFLLLSSLVYERRDALVQRAVEMAINDPQSVKTAQMILRDSMKVISDQAEEWGMRFEGLSDMASNAGPFAGVFYSGEEERKPWMVVVFKGTSPSNFAEFLVDAAINRVPASVFLAGTVHEGFYSDLFPTVSGGADAYGTILRRIKLLAGRLQAEQNSHGAVPLWITGHSLGSALASLFYTRLLLSPQDLGDDLVMKDCYCYGTPRLGDGPFASAFEKASISPLLRENILWRVVNNWDIVTRVPPGLADVESTRDLLGISVLNYAHIGCEAYMKRKVSPGITFNTGVFHQNTTVKIVDMKGKKRYSNPRKDSLQQSGMNVVRLILVLLPPLILDHFPASYYSSLISIDAEKFNHPEKRDLPEAGASEREKEKSQTERRKKA